MKILLPSSCLLILSLWALSSLANNADCRHWPKGMVFVGLTDEGWKTYAVSKAGSPPKKVPLNAEARTPVMSSDGQSLFYVNERGQVNGFSFTDQQITTYLSPSKEAGYAHPEIDEKNNDLFIVQLKQGKSVDTDILSINLATQTTKPIIIQRSAQFEPQLRTPWLYYSHVHCVVGCGKIIQEIWRYHTVSGIAEQLTLLNAISRQPMVDEHNQWLYFSSNAEGYYHLYRQSLDTNTVGNKTALLEKLTDGNVTDGSPALDQGRLYFIRQQISGVNIMCRNAEGQLNEMLISEGIHDIRDLEI
ncbi:hypothetical protein AB835_09675 [Candidatus Endobugula sertula]|uniref:DUF5050 domain-containing protein n=1 Tax=Candidatus Endobugula sertula TaxID=62101 RepID=A0A1D2QP03_9GAMM|nr:hypothetical protein AB835_09675 [Candidatus Endobugula sertula]